MGILQNTCFSTFTLSVELKLAVENRMMPLSSNLTRSKDRQVA